MNWNLLWNMRKIKAILFRLVFLNIQVRQLSMFLAVVPVPNTVLHQLFYSRFALMGLSGLSRRACRVCSLIIRFPCQLPCCWAPAPNTGTCRRHRSARAGTCTPPGMPSAGILEQGPPGFVPCTCSLGTSFPSHRVCQTFLSHYSGPSCQKTQCRNGERSSLWGHVWQPSVVRIYVHAHES